MQPAGVSPAETIRESADPRKKTEQRAFWKTVIAGYMSQSDFSKIQLTAEEDDRMWDRVFERTLLPQKVERLEKSIENLSARRSAALTPRQGKIWRVIQSGAKGTQYCRELHSAGVKPRNSWRNGGCPATYPAAYQSSRIWRQRINDEKSKIRRKAEPGGTGTGR